MTPGEIGERVRRLVKEAAPPGVEQFGFCPLPALSGFLECRGKRLLPKEGGSAILLLLPYQAGEFPGRNVARYALCDDYHRIAGDILQGIIAPLKAAFPGEEFHPFADSSPIPEVEAGALAGLGFAGKNGQLVTPWYGSLAFLCEIVTTLDLPQTGPDRTAGCGDCRRCLAACPTGALSETGLDKAKCRSHITQKKGDLTPWEREEIRKGGMVWGCDLCTAACPHNRETPLSAIPAMREDLEPVLTEENLSALAARKSYGWRGEKVLRRNLSIINNGG